MLLKETNTIIKATFIVYIIGLIRVMFFLKEGEDLLVKLLLPGAAGVGEELFASYTRCWNTVTWFVVTDG